VYTVEQQLLIHMCGGHVGIGTLWEPLIASICRAVGLPMFVNLRDLSILGLNHDGEQHR
jgi:hypothetical protein